MSIDCSTQNNRVAPAISFMINGHEFKAVEIPEINYYPVFAGASKQAQKRIRRASRFNHVRARRKLRSRCRQVKRFVYNYLLAQSRQITIEGDQCLVKLGDGLGPAIKARFPWL